MTVRCPHCQAPNTEDARFCGACGKATSSTSPLSSPLLGEAPAMIGREIAGRYRIHAKLGEGGMGTVYRAEQISLKRTIALKLLRPDVGNNALLLRRFNAEAEAVAKLSHPNTVNIFDFGQDTDGTLFIAMEYIEGKSLRTVVHGEAPLPVRRALTIAGQICASIADAHTHAIIHRDLKPDNVMLQERGRQRDVVRVLDFGIAKLRDDSRATHAMTQAGDMLGTPQYMAPEQIRAEEIDGRTDVYALGCILYEMLTARLPFEAPTVMALLSKHLLEQPPTPSQRRPDLGLPSVIDELVMGAMAKAPEHRPATMEQLGEHIAALLAQLPPDPAYPMSGSVGVPYVPPPLPPRSETPAARSAFAPPTGPPTGPAPYGAATPSFTPASPPIAAAYTPGPPPAAPVFTPAPSASPAPAEPAQPTFQIAAAPSGSKRTLLVVIAVVILGGAGLAAYLGTRPSGQASDATAPGPDEPRQDPWENAKPADPPAAPPSAPPSAPPKNDPWAPAGPSASASASATQLAGETVDVGQGVRFIVPPGFAHEASDDGVVAMDTSRGIMIALGPLDADTDDPKVLAQRYAKQSGLTLQQVSSELIHGAQRDFAVFEGKIDNLPVRHIVVAYVGASYRIALVLHVPQHLAMDAALRQLADDVSERRILLP